MPSRAHRPNKRSEAEVLLPAHLFENLPCNPRGWLIPSQQSLPPLAQNMIAQNIYLLSNATGELCHRNSARRQYISWPGPAIRPVHQRAHSPHHRGLSVHCLPETAACLPPHGCMVCSAPIQAVQVLTPKQHSASVHECCMRGCGMWYVHACATQQPLHAGWQPTAAVLCGGECTSEVPHTPRTCKGAGLRGG